METSPSIANHGVEMGDNDHWKSSLGKKLSMEPSHSSSRKSIRDAKGAGAKMANQLYK